MSAHMAGSDLSQRETASIIAASKVRGTDVYDEKGNSLGSIYDVMLNKREGSVAYAVLSFGGFLGIGNKYHPLPWNKLRYSEELNGYIVDVNKATLEGAPAYGEGDAPDWSQPEYGKSIDDYYMRNPNNVI